MDFTLRILRNPNASIVFSIILGVSLVAIFADFCVSQCLVVDAPAFENAPTFQSRIKGQRIVLMPTLVKHKPDKDLFVEFA